MRGSEGKQWEGEGKGRGMLGGKREEGNIEGLVRREEEGKGDGMDKEGEIEGKVGWNE